MTTLTAFTIPDDPAALPKWLERRLLAPDFGKFVAELTATFPKAEEASAEELLGDWYAPALEDGFAEVPVKRLRRLLQRPSCLLELQEAILTEGGPHWDAVAKTADGFEPAVAKGKAALDRLFAEPPPKSSPKVKAGAPASPTVERRPAKQPRTYKAWAMVATALAACLLLTVGYLAWPDEDPSKRGKFEQVAWGWGRPGGLHPQAANRVEYLNGLAQSADQWFETRPGNSAAVAQRITELRSGCSKLILSNYGPLPPAEKDWLIGKCREWAKEMDAQLAALEGGADAVAVRDAMDATMKTVVTTLREKARAG